MSDRMWTPEQLNCITDRGGTLLVSAAAGSGKTSVLVERLISKITDPVSPVSLDRLLVVTFTKAAAAEMKQRIAKELTKRIAENPSDLHLQRQQLMLPRAAISTVDSFCANLLRENSYLLDISPRFKVAEEQQLLLLRREAMTETLNEFYRTNSPDFLELSSMLTNGKNDKLLLSIIERLYVFIQSHPYPNEWLKKTEHIYDDDLPLFKTVWGSLLLSQIRDDLQKCVNLCRTACSLCEQDEKLTSHYLPALQLDAQLLDELWEQATEDAQWDVLFSRLMALAPNKIQPVRAGADESLKQRVSDLRDEMREQMKSFSKLYTGTESQCRGDLKDTKRAISVLYDIVRRFSVIFSEKKAAQQILDFNDIEHYALQLLTTTDEQGNHTPSSFARELSQQYDEIMVDEYQDTNATQDALFSALSKDESNLFYVGDVKQSIYGFRQAMPELFIGRRTAYSPYAPDVHPSVIVLGNNFRSREQVTDSVNFLFRQLMSERVGGIPYTAEEELVFSAAYEDTDIHETECLVIDGNDVKEKALDKDVAEARVIGHRIRKMLGQLPITDGGAVRSARYGDFCILLRSKKGHAAVYRNELERMGIPVSLDTDNSFLDTAEIRLAISLLRCIDNPTLDVSLTAVMLSPLFGFTPDDLAQIRLFRPSACLYTAICAFRRHPKHTRLAEKCQQFIALVQQYRTLSATMTVDALLRRLYEDTSLPEILSTRVGGAARRENLQLLHDHCRRFEKNGYRGLSSFIRYIDRLQEYEADLPGATVSPSSTDAVRIMSIHASKGLEFPVVFLAGLGGQFNKEALSADLLLHPRLGAGMKRRDPVSYNRYVTLPHLGVSLAIRNDARAEELRVLYVAMTRAREKLCLVMTQNHPISKLSSLAASLTDDGTVSPFSVLGASSMSDWILSTALRHPSADEWRRLVGREDLKPLCANTPWHVEICDVPEDEEITLSETVKSKADADLIAAIRERMAYVYPHLALAAIPTKLAASQSSHEHLGQFIAHSRPAFLSHIGLTPAERGTAMHTFMQYADLSAAAVSPKEEASRLVKSGFLTAEQARSLKEPDLQKFFNSSLYKRIAKSTRCLREYHFTCRHSAAKFDASLPADTNEFLIVQGMVDCLFEENGQLVIVDYKTDQVSKETELIEHYRSQLLIYRDAISEALELPVKECLLYSFTLGREIAIE